MHQTLLSFLLPVDNKAEIDIQNDGGYTALIFAAERGNKKVVEHLLKAGAVVLAVAKNNDSALKLAKKNGHQEIVKMLEKELVKN